MLQDTARTLLLVDDEENILRALKRLLRRDGYNILTAESGSKGFELLKDNDVGVIISDQRMPEMSGVEFLNKVKDQYPDNVRIVLSGYTDLNSVTDAINKGAIYKFLTKPWDDDLLRNNVRAAFEHHELARENIRLTCELKKANEQLARANVGLKNDIEEKEHVAEINLHTLQIAQEVLEHFPMGILGIGEYGMIALANLKAREFFEPGNGPILGSGIAAVLPRKLEDCVRECIANRESIYRRLQLHKNDMVGVTIYPMGRKSNSRGVIVVLDMMRDTAI